MVATDAGTGDTDIAPDGPTVRIGPYRVGRRRAVLGVSDADLAAELDDQLGDLRVDPDTLAEDGGPDTEFLVARQGLAWLSHPWGVWRDGEPCETTVSDDYIRPYVLWEVTRLLLENCRPMIPVHAAAVTRNGQAIVLAGQSHAGKSTLAGWLTAHGWGFLTDEVALLERRDDGSTWVQPFWRPIGVRRPGPLDALIEDASGADEVLVAASTLGSLGESAPLTAILFPDRDADVPRHLVARHPATAVRELASHLPRLGEDGRSGFLDIVDVVERVPVFTLGVDDLDAAAATLAALTDGGPGR